MPLRSTRITLYNNTCFPLKLVGSNLCEGKWTDGSQPPPVTIDAGMNFAGATLAVQHPLWQSESGDGVLLGTRGWVNYMLEATTVSQDGTTQSPELVTICWDNPFVWDIGTVPIDFRHGVTPPCNEDQRDGWSFPGIGVGPPQHELFISDVINNGKEFNIGTGPVGVGIDIALFWPALATMAFIQALGDVNLEYTLGLRKKGSVGSTICSFYNGNMGLKSLADKAGQSSLKKLFNF